MAAMHALGPYELENADVESSLVYSNNQPSSSIRAPTAPQVCWALEQHMDELAEALGLDPVELRRRTLIEEGSVTATGQVLEQIAMKETLERAVELIGDGADLPDDEAIGVACGWWPCFTANAGAYVKLNPDGTGTIVTGAQENGTGAVMAMPALRRGGARDEARRTSRSSTRTRTRPRGTWARAARRRRSTASAPCSPRPSTLREQLLDAAAETLEAARDDLELADGIGARQGVARQVGHDRRPSRATARSTARARARSPTPPAPAEGCVGRLGNESFHAPQLIAHAAHVKVDRDTGVVRVLRIAAAHDCGRILNRIGADGQVYGGVVMGIGQALSEGTQLDELGRHRNPHLLDYKLVTASDAPRIDIAWIETETANAGPKGSKGVGEPPCVPTAGAIANAIAKVIGARVRQLPMTPERVWEASRDDDVRDRERPWTRHWRLSRRARGPLRAARISSSARARGRRRCPTRSSRSTGSTSSAAIEERGRRASARRAGRRTSELVAHPVVRERFTGARRRVGDRRLARDARAGDDRRQPDERVTRDGDRWAAHVPRRERDAAVGLGYQRRSPSATCSPGPERPSPSPGELLVSVELPSATSATGSAYVRLEYRRQMEIAVVGATAARHARRRHRDARAGRDHRPRADDPAGRQKPRQRWKASSGEASDVAARGARGRGRISADLRRPRVRALSTGDGRGDRATRDRGGARPRARRRRPDPGERERS